MSEADLNERGFGENPQFEVTLAEDASRGDLLGMAVHYQIEFTYDLKPDLVLKELFVAEAARGQGVGAALMRELNRIAGRRGCGRIKWLVMRGNDVARQFYRSLGAKQDLKWENWFMTVDPGLEG